MSEDLFFNSNEAAFEYACKYLDNSLDNERAVLGIVLAVKGRKCIVRFATAGDASIPTAPLAQLLEEPDLTKIAYGIEPIDRVPNLSRGDLVMYVAARAAMAAGKPGIAGIITARVKRTYITSKGGWQLFPMEH